MQYSIQSLFKFNYSGRDVSVVDALKMWDTWQHTVPPCDEIGDKEADLHLAIVFSVMTHCTDHQQRIELVERHLLSLDKASHFPNPYKPVPLQRAILCAWAIDLCAAVMSGDEGIRKTTNSDVYTGEAERLAAVALEMQQRHEDHYPRGDSFTDEQTEALSADSDYWEHRAP